jgi:P-type Ca2+ transporter type 2C
MVGGTMLKSFHTLALNHVFEALESSPRGLTSAEAGARLEQYGPNRLPQAKPASLLVIVLRQFRSPLIYLLLIAAVVSLILGEYTDAVFIGAVLFLNSLIGTIQEYNAQKSAEALRKLSVTRCHALRDGEEVEINAELVVPGDLVLLETGAKVPADLRLVYSGNLEVDESLLTGESLAVSKNAEAVAEETASLGDRRNMAFAGTLVTRGRGRGVAVNTGADTQLGAIAEMAQASGAAKPPLLIRMDRFVHWLSIIIIAAAAVVTLGGVARGLPLGDVFMLAVALAVAAVPEGLPVVLTIALAIATKRMSRRNVIVRKLVAVEALGSCTYIASDKTGTLTLNQLTVRRVCVPGQQPWEITGQGMIPEGELLPTADVEVIPARSAAERIALASTLCNEGSLARRNGHWVQHGDAVDVALLVFAGKLGINRHSMEQSFPQLAQIPFESDRQFAATLVKGRRGPLALVKGAYERLLPMCASAAGISGEQELDPEAIARQAEELAADGYRVLAVAEGVLAEDASAHFTPELLKGLTLLGLVAIMDPLRPDAQGAVAACRTAGVRVAMVTGDHPATALAIARELGMAESRDQVVTGPQLAQADPAGQEQLASRARVFARVEPRQKLEIVQALQRAGHYVAVTGDGANDAPALRAAHVGVAMGQAGTDVARETADLILADDNFASIVAGVEEGRVAYGNVRKVIFLLISTGAGTIVAFLATLALGPWLPEGVLTNPALFVATQLLWLNLVTNGIQDVALAFEPAEGDELKRAPRKPGEPIFNRWMIETSLLSAVVIGAFTCGTFMVLLLNGAAWFGWASEDVERNARNLALMLMVLFQNFQVFNARSETRSLFTLNPLKNKFLFFGVLAAQAVHIGAMYTPGLRDVLRLETIRATEWLMLLAIGSSLFVTMEVYKLVRRRLEARRTAAEV